MNADCATISDIPEFLGVIRINASLRHFPRIRGDIFYPAGKSQVSMLGLTRINFRCTVKIEEKYEEPPAWKLRLLVHRDAPKRALTASLPLFGRTEIPKGMPSESIRCLFNWTGCEMRAMQSESQTMLSQTSRFDFPCDSTKNANLNGTAVTTSRNLRKFSRNPFRKPAFGRLPPKNSAQGGQF
jgi:hypothetical protein